MADITGIVSVKSMRKSAAASVDHVRSASLETTRPLPAVRLSSLHIGMGWHDEQPGGLNRMVMNLLSYLPAENVTAQAIVAGSSQVEVLSRGRAKSFGPLTDPLPLRLLRCSKAVREAVRELSPDLIALHFPLFGLLAVEAVHHVPLIVHFHGPWAMEGAVEGSGAFPTAIKHWVERRAYRRACRFITLSEAFADVLEQHYGVDRRCVRVVPGGVDVDRFQPSVSRAEARAAMKLPLDRPIVVTVRRLARRMGLPDLLGAFDCVRRRIPDALLVIAGSGPLSTSLQAQVDARGLTHRVLLLGHVIDNHLPFLYRAADLSVVPSTALEGFGLTSVESLAAGTPVLVTPVGGLPEVVRGLSSAMVLPAVGPSAIANGIIAALRGDITLPSSGACVDYARRNFSWLEIARRIGSVYRESIA